MLLAAHFLKRLAAQMGSDVPALSEEAMAALMHYSFPGNVRELENILERAVTLCENNVIQRTDLRLSSQTSSSQAAQTDEKTGALNPYLDSLQKDAIVKALEQTRHNKTAAAKLLGITFRALRYRLKKLGLD